MKKISLFVVFVISAVLELSAATYYVKNTGDNAKDGLSWANAFSTIQKAVTTAAASDEIRVGQGTFYEAITITVTKSLTIKGGYDVTTGNQDYTNKTIFDGSTLSPTRRMIFITGSTTTVAIDGCIIKNYTSSGAGGALYFDTDASGILTNCSFINNIVTGTADRGGAVGFNGTSQAQVGTIVNCEFYGNSTGNGGSAILGSNSLLNVFNCTFANNTSTSTDWKGGIFSTGRLNLKNSIMWGNDVYQINTPRGTIYLENNVIQNGLSGIRNRDNPTSIYPTIGAAVDANNNDPLFVNQSTGNLNLTATSPAVNVGKDLSASGVTTDILGFTRPIGDGKVDLGAYEFITYQSKNTGNWSDYTKWQISADGTTFSDVANSSYVPTSSLAGSVNVLNGHTITIDANATARALTVNAGGKLTLNSTIALTASSLTLQSDATNGTGTFLDNGTTTVTGTTTVNQSFQHPSGLLRTWYVSSPVATEVTPTPTLSIIKSYDETINDGTPAHNWISSTTMVAKKGYQVVPALAANNIAFTGTLNNSNQDIPLTNRGGVINKAGFNLIGNPYPSYLDWDQVMANTSNANLLRSTTMWYRTKKTNDLSQLVYQFWTVNGDGVGSPNGASAKIPPMQGFWVRANAAGNLALTNTMRSHAPATDKLLKAPASKNSAITLLRLQVSNGTNTDEAVIYESMNASNGLDAFDSPKMNNDNDLIPEIYTTLGNEQIVINSMNSLPKDTHIGLGFIPGSATSFSITANEVSNLPSDVKVILRDNATMAETDLTDGVSTYSFIPATIVGDRFSVIFRTKGTATGVDNSAKLNAQVFVNSANQITIIAPEKSNYAIYSAVGQLIETGIVNSKLITNNSKLSSGVYIVKVGSQSTRVIVK